VGFFDQHAVTLQRPTGAPGRASSGYMNPTTYAADVTIRGNLQRPKRRTTETHPEGERSADEWDFATATELRALDEPDAVPGDRIVVPPPLAHPTKSIAYEVREVSGPGMPGPLAHYEARLVRVSEGQDPP